MATIAYPPSIGGVLPAFCLEGTNRADTKITIPLKWNPAVASSEVAAFQIKVSTVNNSQLVGTVRVEKNPSGSRNGVAGYFSKTDTVVFDFKHKTGGVQDKNQKVLTALKAGQYYKIQLCYVGAVKNGSTTTAVFSPYSTVGIIKCITKPTLAILNLKTSPASGANKTLHTYTAEYKCSDFSEKLYSSYFQITNSDNTKVLYKSDEILHNSLNDTIITETNNKNQEVEYSVGIEKINIPLAAPTTQILSWHITTVNGLERTVSYPIKDQASSGGLSGALSVTNNFAEGYLKIRGKITSSVSGNKTTLTLYRAEYNQENTELIFWFQVGKIKNVPASSSQTSYSTLFKDRTVEQGKKYIYAVESDDIAGRLTTETKPVQADFEDAFLFDGKRQLKLRFNQKVSSIKDTILEQKTDTIGGRFPIFQRNGSVRYKELPLSGTISFLQDDLGSFASDLLTERQNLGTALPLRPSTPTSAGTIAYEYGLNSDTLYQERLFKLRVLDWLNNGEYKVLRTPSEGNYIVRLMSVSLSPLSESINRMIHNFSATAYEVAEFNETELKKYNLF